VLSLTKRTKNPQVKLKIPLLLERGVIFVEAGVDAVDVAAPVVVVLQVVALTVPVVAIATLTVPTLPVVSLHRLPLTVTPLPPTRSLKSPAPIPALVGAPHQSPKLEHLLRDGAIPILPGVTIQLPMVQ
jgi:hypothetical protein